MRAYLSNIPSRAGNWSFVTSMPLSLPPADDTAAARDEAVVASVAYNCYEAARDVGEWDAEESAESKYRFQRRQKQQWEDRSNITDMIQIPPQENQNHAFRDDEAHCHDWVPGDQDAEDEGPPSRRKNKMQKRIANKIKSQTRDTEAKRRSKLV